MADSFPLLVPPPSPPPFQRAVSDNDLDTPSDADQQLRASGEVNIGELLNRIFTLKQMPGDMQRLQLQPPPQNGFPNAAGQIPGASLTPPQQGYGLHQPGMPFGFPQMAMPWNFGHNPNPGVGPGQGLPWTYAGSMPPYQQHNMLQNSLQQVSDFSSGYVSQLGYSSHLWGEVSLQLGASHHYEDNQHFGDSLFRFAAVEEFKAEYPCLDIHNQIPMIHVASADRPSTS
ncbi:hypothetical protein ACEPPN_006716 [Leptodophora sp. 'Broadleaf-Isolate-01']